MVKKIVIGVYNIALKKRGKDMELVCNSNQENHLEKLNNLASKADHCTIASPFLAANMNKILNEINSSLTLNSIELITVNKGFGDNNNPIAMEEFVNYCNTNNIKWNIRIDEHLHGKLYLFYKNNKSIGFVLSSANLTDSGLNNIGTRFHHEYGILSSNSSIQSEIYDELHSNFLQELLESEITAMASDTRKKKLLKPLAPNVPLVPSKVNELINNKISRCILKPSGTSQGRFSLDWNKEDFIECKQRFCTRTTENISNPGDILINYAIDNIHRIMGIYQITTGKLVKDNEYEEWPHYFESTNLIPEYTNYAFDNEEFIDLEACEIEFKKIYKGKYIMHNTDRLPNLGTRSDHFILSPEFTEFVYYKLAKYL
jgi:HKD family nuclease